MKQNSKGPSIFYVFARRERVKYLTPRLVPYLSPCIYCS